MAHACQRTQYIKCKKKGRGKEVGKNTKGWRREKGGGCIAVRKEKLSLLTQSQS